MKKLFTISVILLAGQMAFGQLTAGNIVVSRLGDGTTALTNVVPVSIVEFNPTPVYPATATRTITFPSSSTVAGLVINGNSAAAALEGGISLSTDGRYIVIGGMDAKVGAASAGTLPKIFGRVSSTGIAETYSIAPATFYTSFIRHAVSIDGSRLWATSNPVTGYVDWLGTSGASQLSGSSYRNLAIAKGMTGGVSVDKLFALKTGEISIFNQMTGTATATTFVGLSSISANAFGFTMLDMDNAVSNSENGDDVIYISDQGTSAGTSGIIKLYYDKATSTWTSAGKYISNDYLYGMTARINANNQVEIYAVKGVGENNKIVSIIDKSGRTSFDVSDNAKIVETDIASAGAKYVFRSVAFSPTVTVLPLKLTSFSGSSTLNGAVLKWTTTNEVNVKNISLMRKTADNDFKTVKIISPKNGTANLYQADDLGLAFGTYYYQLKTTDLDGTESLSQIVSVEVKGSNTLSVYPNPAQDFITVQFPKVSKNASLKVFNTLGNTIEKASLEASSTQYRLNISKYNSGYYIIQINDGLKTQSISFVK